MITHVTHCHFERTFFVREKSRTGGVMSPQPITGNTLFYGDNLPILRDHIPDESVDLDPPFNSKRRLC